MTERAEHALVVLGMICLVLAIGGAALAQSDPEERLEAARVLYRQGRFEEAIAELREVVTTLEQFRAMGDKRQDLAAAHFLLGLTYFAVRNESAAKDNFRRALSFDPERTPDPEVFAPRVVELYEEARREILETEQEPAFEAATPPRRRDGESDSLAIGLRVRAAVSGTGKRVVGDILRVDEHNLTLLSRQRQTVALPRSSIGGLEISKGRRGHPWWGLAIGAGAGALLGAIETPDDESCVAENCYTRAENITYGSLGGGLIGALVGALCRTEQWLEIPSEGLAVRVGANRLGPGVVVALSF